MNEHVELRLRSASSWTVGRDGTFVDDLEALAAEGAIDDYEVKMWSDHVPVDDGRELSETEREVRERVETIEAWADEHGYELPGFTETTKARGFDGPRYEATVLPLATLLGFEDGELRWMAPYSDGDEHVAVQDRLDELAARTVDPEPAAGAASGGQLIDAE